jgi:fido (protein-threonine AMPylation protein)
VSAAVPPPFTRTPHLVALVAGTERLAALVASVDPPADLLDRLHAEAAVASLRLDGSPIREVPDPAEVPPDAAELPRLGHDQATTGTWLDALRAGQEPDREVMLLEYRGVRAGLAADDLADELLTRPVQALGSLHRRVTRGLLAPDVAGRPRRTRQAVHDASVGRVLYHATEPGRIHRRLALLGAWLTSTAAREHGLIASGVLHQQLLEMHPFEAANGRLARTAARLVLRARGLDPAGLALAEPVLLDDALGYYDEVAATRRRNDLTIWLERWAEAVVAGLRLAARRLGVPGGDVPPRAADFLAGWSGPRFTVADYRAEAGVGPEEARGDLDALLDAGRIRRVPGSRGLRFTVV